MPAGSQHCGMIPTQSEIPLLLEIVSLVFFWIGVGYCLFGLFVLQPVPVFLVLQWYFISRSRHCGSIATKSEIPLLLEHVLLVWRFFATHVLFDVFVFPPVVFVLQWYALSRSLVGQRWCSTWCLVIFVWLQCDMRSSACWIAKLWHDTYAVEIPLLLENVSLVFLDRCRFLFVWLVCPSTGPRVLGITVVLYF